MSSDIERDRLFKFCTSSVAAQPSSQFPKPKMFTPITLSDPVTTPAPNVPDPDGGDPETTNVTEIEVALNTVMFVIVIQGTLKLTTELPWLKCVFWPAMSTL